MTVSNCVILTGKVVTPSRLHYRPDGSPVIQFLLEVNDPEDQLRQPCPAGRRGQNRIHVVAIGKLAEFDPNLLQTGQPLTVIGRLNQRSWRTPEGRSRSRTEVIATDLRTTEAKNQGRKSKNQGE
jgi:single-stranded DNA-binding protein